MDEIGDLKETQDQPEPVRRRKSRSGWMVGAILVAAGLLILLSNYTALSFNNWWALFILLPAMGAFVDAARKRRDAGRFNRSARSSLMGGLFLTLVAMIFLLNLDWSKAWPSLVILAGVGALLGALFDN